eukprot:TRINITY_DN13515_c0_g1_i1.p1 TRINITY_DN13515_c0_g1~~TRINITY_DN13515_c0_g1_i1.p1  ORF type:complete len:393 (+),score=91.37 TRINITY_DN13515_c0_g1_i1:147-1181(+)
MAESATRAVIKDGRDPELMNWVKNQKKCVLHRHLEGSVPHRVMWDFQQRGLIPTTFKTFEEMKAAVTVTKPLSDLQEVLDRFTFHELCFATIPMVEEVTREAILDAALVENINKLEFRFSPAYMAKTKKLDWDEMMFAILRGRDAAMTILKEQHNFHMQLGFIAIVSRDLGYAAAQETVDFVKKYREHFCGFDFAAAENALPATDLVPIVEQVKKMRLHLTCHSGEGSSVENIRTMVSLYEPERLGHATKLIEDPELMKQVKAKNILVEANPSSNILTNSVYCYEQHPLQEFYRFGVPVSISDDDGTVFDVNINDEWYYVLSLMKMSKDDLLRMNEMASKHSFI